MTVSVRITGANADNYQHQIDRERWLCANAGMPYKDWLLHVVPNRGDVIYHYMITDINAAMMFKLMWGGNA